MKKIVTGTILDVEYTFEVDYDHTEADNGISESIDISSITPVGDRARRFELERELLDLLKEESKEAQMERKINNHNQFGGMNAGITG
jgi:hypothetical protein